MSRQTVEVIVEKWKSLTGRRSVTEGTLEVKAMSSIQGSPFLEGLQEVKHELKFCSLKVGTIIKISKSLKIE